MWYIIIMTMKGNREGKMMEKKLIVPIIHLNGSSQESLEIQYHNAARSVMDAINELSNSGPNQRDYYPQGEEAWRCAKEEHESRVNRLRSVYDELLYLFNTVSDL